MIDTLSENRIRTMLMTYFFHDNPPSSVVALIDELISRIETLRKEQRQWFDGKDWIDLEPEEVVRRREAYGTDIMKQRVAQRGVESYHTERDISYTFTQSIKVSNYENIEIEDLAYMVNVGEMLKKVDEKIVEEARKGKFDGLDLKPCYHKEYEVTVRRKLDRR